MANELRVNFSDQEAASEGREFNPLPSGTYYVRVTDIETREVKEGKNAGKSYWHVEFTVQDGEYADRKIWTNAMLFEGALYTIAQLLKSTGFEKSLQTGVIPSPDKLISKECLVIVKKMRDAYAEERDGDGEPQFKNEVKGIKPYEGTGSKAGGSKKAGSLLP